MSDRVTLAQLLSHVFTQLHATLGSGKNQALFQGWRDVLGGPGMGEMDVFENLGLVSSSMTRLQRQIAESNRLPELARKSGQQTLSEFAPLFQFGNFHQNGAAFIGHCSEKVRGDLGMIGLALSYEFSEPKLQTADADDVAASLREIQKLLAQSTLSLDLRVNLEKHLKTMLWWLGHPDMTSAQDLFEMIGAAMIISNQLADRATSSTDGNQQAAGGIKDLIGTVGKKLSQIVGFSVANADKIGTLVHAAGEASKLVQ
jgi:hypothetical protein